jgi:hypothetical protein
MKNRSHPTQIVIAAMFLLTVPAVAYGQSANPQVGEFGIGAAVGIVNGTSQLKFTQTYGYHFSGRNDGFALGLELQESVANSQFVFETGPKAWVDIPLSDRIPLYLSPSAMVGVAIGTTSDSNQVSSGSSSASVAFDMQFGVAMTLILERFTLKLKPFSFDIAIGDQFVARYDIMMCFGANF